jgi:hypothetical protein
VLLEDPQQQLYGDREAFAINGEVTIRSPENYRSPRALVRLVNGLRLTDEPAEALGPYEGELPDPIVCATGKTAKDWVTATQRAVQRCLDRGFALEDIAVVTLRGRASSVLLEQEALGKWPLRRFTGTYDAQGEPVWTQGVLLIDTVYRFKGQAAHCRYPLSRLDEGLPISAKWRSFGSLSIPRRVFRPRLRNSRGETAASLTRKSLTAWLQMSALVSAAGKASMRAQRLIAVEKKSRLEIVMWPMTSSEITSVS